MNDEYYFGGIDPPSTNFEQKEKPCGCGYTLSDHEEKFKFIDCKMRGMIPLRYWICRTCGEAALTELVDIDCKNEG